jgi:hypothetical protein
MGWDNGADQISLQFVTRVGAPSFIIEVVTAGVAQRFDTVEAFAQYQ